MICVDPPRFLASTRQMTDSPSSIPTSRHPTMLDEEQAKKIRFAIKENKLLQFLKYSFN